MLHVGVIPIGGSCGVVCTGCDPVGFLGQLLYLFTSEFKQNLNFHALVKQKEYQASPSTPAEFDVQHENNENKRDGLEQGYEIQEASSSFDL